MALYKGSCEDSTIPPVFQYTIKTTVFLRSFVIKNRLHLQLKTKQSHIISSWIQPSLETTKVMSHIRRPQFNIWNISYITYNYITYLLEIYYFEVNLILEAMLHAKLALVAWFTDILLVL